MHLIRNVPIYQREHLITLVINIHRKVQELLYFSGFKKGMVLNLLLLGLITSALINTALTHLKLSNNIFLKPD